MTPQPVNTNWLCVCIFGMLTPVWSSILPTKMVYLRICLNIKLKKILAGTESPWNWIKIEKLHGHGQSQFQCMDLLACWGWGWDWDWHFSTFLRLNLIYSSTQAFFEEITNDRFLCDIKLVPHAAAELSTEFALLHVYAGTKCNLDLVFSKRTYVNVDLNVSMKQWQPLLRSTLRGATVYFPFRCWVWDQHWYVHIGTKTCPKYYFSL